MKGVEKMPPLSIMIKPASALCNICNIDNRATLHNSAAYIYSWLSTLRSDKKLIVHASGQAQKAVQYILNTNKNEA